MQLSKRLKRRIAPLFLLNRTVDFPQTPTVLDKVQLDGAFEVLLVKLQEIKFTCSLYIQCKRLVYVRCGWLMHNGGSWFMYSVSVDWSMYGVRVG